jgi:two-component system phosphate regulon response regulator OmpR
MAPRKILIIDDDEKLNRLLKTYLSGFGFSVTSCLHPSAGLKASQNDFPDLIILDIMLPDMDGFEVCREIRKTSSTPVIMLTARGDITDRIVGLELGADDYLPKPFEPRELLARIQTVLRRTNGSIIPDSTLKFADLEIIPSRQQVLLKGVDIEMTTMEFQLLFLFVEKRGRIVTRDMIMESLRGSDWLAFDRSIDVAVSRLRQKLQDDPKSPRFIKTVWGTGYMFIGHE